MQPEGHCINTGCILTLLLRRAGNSNACTLSLRRGCRLESGQGFNDCRQSSLKTMYAEATRPDLAEQSTRFRRDIAHCLRRWRVEAEMTQADAGAVINVTRSPISSLETGERECALDEFFKLLQAYEVPMITGYVHALLIYQQNGKALAAVDVIMLRLIIQEMRRQGYSMPVLFPPLFDYETRDSLPIRYRC